MPEVHDIVPSYTQCAADKPPHNSFSGKEGYQWKTMKRWSGPGWINYLLHAMAGADGS